MKIHFKSLLLLSITALAHADVSESAQQPEMATSSFLDASFDDVLTFIFNREDRNEWVYFFTTLISKDYLVGNRSMELNVLGKERLNKVVKTFLEKLNAHDTIVDDLMIYIDNNPALLEYDAIKTLHDGLVTLRPQVNQVAMQEEVQKETDIVAQQDEFQSQTQELDLQEEAQKETDIVAQQDELESQTQELDLQEEDIEEDDDFVDPNVVTQEENKLQAIEYAKQEELKRKAKERRRQEKEQERKKAQEKKAAAAAHKLAVQKQKEEERAQQVILQKRAQEHAQKEKLLKQAQEMKQQAEERAQDEMKRQAEEHAQDEMKRQVEERARQEELQKQAEERARLEEIKRFAAIKAEKEAEELAASEALKRQIEEAKALQIESEKNWMSKVKLVGVAAAVGAASWLIYKLWSAPQAANPAVNPAGNQNNGAPLPKP